MCIALFQSRQRKLMNRARSDRSLGAMEERTHKRLKTVGESEQETGAQVSDVLLQPFLEMFGFLCCCFTKSFDKVNRQKSKRNMKKIEKRKKGTER